MNKRIALLTALTLVAVVLASAAAGAHQEEASNGPPGLGSYGTHGPITRDKLPEGIRDRVSDDAIALAASPALADARAGWDREGDFVDQVDYQLEFRSYTDFMSTRPEHIARVLTEKPQNMGDVSMGLFMTDEEAAEMARRDELGDRMDLIVDAVTPARDPAAEQEGALPDYGPSFGGVWQDQHDGGRIVLAVVDASHVDVAAIQKLVGGPENLTIVEQPFTFNEIEQYRRQLMNELNALEVSWDIEAVRSERGRLLEVRVPDLTALPPTFGRDIPDGAFTVVEGPGLVPAGYPTANHAWANQQPGLRIGVHTPDGGVWCTWGFNGHTSLYHYIVTAGHCFEHDYNNNSGWEDDVEIKQGSKVLTSGSRFLFSQDTTEVDIARMSSGWADDNCYHGNPNSEDPHCMWPMKHRAQHNSWETESDRTCASLGTSNTYRCGYILEEHTGSSGRSVRAGFKAIKGDSGSGAKWDYRIDGIIIEKTGNAASQAVFMTAWDVQQNLGPGYFYFNCANGETRHFDPSLWGACPSVNA